VVSRSSTEVEYRSLAIATTKLYWLRMLFHEIKIPLSTTPIIWCDNVSALSLAANPVYHARTKHIEVDYHYVREKVLNRDVKVSFISTANQIADVFTKGLTSARFLYLKSKLKVIPSPFSLRGHVKHTIHSDEPVDVPAIQQTSDDPVDVLDTSTLDDLAVHTADVPVECSYRDKAS
jgi:hypothetical protein